MSAVSQACAGRPLRVALDCRLLDWPGIGRYCGELARALVEVAPEMRFFWLCRAGDAGRLPRAAGATPLVLRAAPMSLFEQIEVPLALVRERIALLHAPAAQTLPVLVPRLVVTFHDLTLRRFPEFLPSRLGRLYYRAMTGVAAWRARRLVAVSEYTRREVETLWPGTAGRVTVVVNGVSPAFRPITAAGERARVAAALGLPESFLLFVGTWKRHKNLPALLRAYGRLAPALRRRCPLVVVARADPRYPEVPRAAREAGVETEVRWLCDVPEPMMPALYSMARGVVLPSLSEGFGLPVAEAMACGTPAAVADAGALPEIGADACLAFAPQDAAAMTEALRRLIEDDALHERLGRNALARARAFDWSAAARDMARLYREALA
jgi:glycosyltransferase involved in cell wall biosynthesis